MPHKPGHIETKIYDTKPEQAWEDLTPERRVYLNYLEIATKINVLRGVDFATIPEDQKDIYYQFGDDPRTKTPEAFINGKKPDLVYPGKLESSIYAKMKNTLDKIKTDAGLKPMTIAEGLIEPKYFSPDDAEKFVRQTVTEYYNSIGIENPSEKQIEKSVIDFGSKLLRRIELDDTNELSYNPDSDFIDIEKRFIYKRSKETKYTEHPIPILTTGDTEIAENERKSDPANALLDKIEKQILNDSSMVLNGDIIGHLARESAKKGLFGDPRYEEQIMDILTSTSDVAQIPQGLLDSLGMSSEELQDQLSNWITTTSENLPYIRSYLDDGLIHNIDGDLVSPEPLSGWKLSDGRLSLTALI